MRTSPPYVCSRICWWYGQGRARPMVSVKKAETSPVVANVSRWPRSRSPSRHAYSRSNSRVTDSGVRKAAA
uniref:Uncharacterized protein n=1 Tax=Human herpesvirus 2 TaxID=10310 RepID=A0A481TVD1_HHV2|nr:hypothetical protein [Human alphaherpesvirus 2]